MSAIKLTVSNLANPEDEREYIFDQDHITIGRARGNRLSLSDPKRIVSGEHAEIRWDGDTYQVIDLGSKNFTYLNGERLISGQPYPVQDGDTFRIGDFELSLEVVDRGAADSGQTVFDPRFSNPFEDQVDQLADLLTQIRDTFDSEAPNRRKDALEKALHDLLGTDEERHETEVMIGRLLAASEEALADDRSMERNRGAERPGDAFQAVSQESTSASDSRSDRLIQVLLRGVARLINIPWQFRHEFIGQTIVQSANAGFLYEGDVDALRDQLVHSSLSEEEFCRRLELLEGAMEDLMRHQVAMIEGYKASAQAGSRKLLDVLDPKNIKDELSSESKIYELVPLLVRVKGIHRLQQRCDELKAEDWSVAERRVFRPTFIKAYLARMTSPERERSEADQL